MDEQHRAPIGSPDLFIVNLVQTAIKLAAAKRRLDREQLFFLDECIRHEANISHYSEA